MKLTNIHKHFVLMLLLGILAWAFAYIGKAQGLGYFPNIAAFMITVWVEYRQWSRNGEVWTSRTDWETFTTKVEWKARLKQLGIDIDKEEA